MAKLFDHRWETKLIEARNFRRDQTKDRAITVRLFQKIAAKTRLFIHLVGEIEVSSRLKNVPSFVATHFAQHFSCFFAGNGLVPDWPDVAMPTHLGRLALGDVQVGRAFCNDDGQQVIHMGHFFNRGLHGWHGWEIRIGNRGYPIHRPFGVAQLFSNRGERS